MYSVGKAYLLWFLSFFGFFGFHRFYLRKIPTGLLWMCSFGFFTVGAIYDFFTLSGQVQRANLREALNMRMAEDRVFGRAAWGARQSWRFARDARARIFREQDSLERCILRQAKEDKGILTVSKVALAADVSLEEAKKALDTLVSRGFAELRVRKSGGLVYTLPEFMEKGGDLDLEDF
jgi:hypothetical protein